MKSKCRDFFFVLLTVLFLFIFVLIISEGGDYYAVLDEKQNIDEILLKGITEDEYAILKKQTGLSEDAVNEILAEDDASDVLHRFQEQNFSEYNVLCNYLCFPVTKYETLVDKEKEIVTLEIPKLKTGDILITKSTHTLTFRHGHTGLVVDGEDGIVLEALALGIDSSYGNVDMWRSYPTLAILRPKNLSKKEIDNVVKFAKENLYNIKYGLTAGIFDGAFDENKQVNKTHCSHLVWYAYMSGGVDIDSNGGQIVLPEDILRSDKLELIWSYGINALK